MIATLLGEVVGSGNRQGNHAGDIDTGWRIRKSGISKGARKQGLKNMNRMGERKTGAGYACYRTCSVKPSKERRVATQENRTKEEEEREAKMIG
jgi:hypothetical protein